MTYSNLVRTQSRCLYNIRIPEKSPIGISFKEWWIPCDITRKVHVKASQG